jgi:hypothetical protein
MTIGRCARWRGRRLEARRSFYAATPAVQANETLTGTWTDLTQSVIGRWVS